MSASIGRNDPCPCGSGRKYKKCCLAADAATSRSVGDLQKVKEALDERIFEFAGARFGEDAIDRAWREFTGEDRDFDPEDPDEDLFFHWYLHDWNPHRLTGSTDHSIASAFLEARGGELSPAEIDIIEHIAGSHTSFHEITEILPDQRLRLRDLLTGAERRVFDSGWKGTVTPGHIICGRVVEFAAGGILAGCGGALFAGHVKEILRPLRAQLRASTGMTHPRTLRPLDRNFVTLYLGLLRNEPPVTFGEGVPPFLEEIIFARADGDLYAARYQVPSADGAYAAMRVIATGETDADLRLGALVTPEGRLIDVVIPWNSTTCGSDGLPELLGWVEIDDRRMEAFAFDAAHAAELDQLVRERVAGVVHERSSCPEPTAGPAPIRG